MQLTNLQLDIWGWDGKPPEAIDSAAACDFSGLSSSSIRLPPQLVGASTLYHQFPSLPYLLDVQSYLANNLAICYTVVAHFAPLSAYYHPAHSFKAMRAERDDFYTSVDKSRLVPIRVPRNPE
jgi:hypothetical protein